jgi:hypothetical protein
MFLKRQDLHILRDKNHFLLTFFKFQVCTAFRKADTPEPESGFHHHRYERGFRQSSRFTRHNKQLIVLVPGHRAPALTPSKESRIVSVCVRGEESGV